MLKPEDKVIEKLLGFPMPPDVAKDILSFTNDEIPWSYLDHVIRWGQCWKDYALKGKQNIKDSSC